VVREDTAARRLRSEKAPAGALAATCNILLADPDLDGPTAFAARLDVSVDITHVVDGAQALFLAGRDRPDVIVLRAGLPEVRLPVLARVIREFSDAPMLLCVGPGEIEGLGAELGLALVAGVSEVLEWPYTSGRTLDRIGGIVDQIAGERLSRTVLELGGLTLDRLRFEVRVHGVPVTLTAREFAILTFLMMNTHRTVTAAEIHEGAWPSGSQLTSGNLIQVHLRRIRRAVAPAADIVNLRNVGYRLTAIGSPGSGDARDGV
jgi:DNA-binding response OmpR family regulator